MAKKKTSATPNATSFVPYDSNQWTAIADNSEITTDISTINTNLSHYNSPVLASITTRTEELRTDIKPVGYDALASSLTTDASNRLVTDTEIAFWNANDAEKIQIDLANAKVTRGNTTPPEDITTEFRYAAGGTPYMSEITNDGASATSPDPYINTRDVFALHNVTVDTYEDNTDGDDSDYFGYTAILDLSDYLFDGTNYGNCIYPEECKEIEKYSAMISFNQSSADMVSINKITRTEYDNGNATVKFNTTFPIGTITLNSILFIQRDRNVLPETYTAVDFLQVTEGTPYINTTLAKDWTGQFGFTISEFNTSYSYNVVIGNGDYFGMKKGSDDKWYFVYNYCGTENVSTIEAIASTYYHVEIVDMDNAGTEERKVFVNGELIFTLTKGTGSSSAIYLFANNNSGTAENFAKIKLYPVKLYDMSTKLLVGDYSPCTLVNVPKLYNLVDKTVLDVTGSTIVGGYDPNIKDYILHGTRVPTSATRGKVNQFYRVTGTTDYYVCLGRDTSTGGYIWQKSLLALVYEYV